MEEEMHKDDYYNQQEEELEHHHHHHQHDQADVDKFDDDESSSSDLLLTSRKKKSIRGATPPPHVQTSEAAGAPADFNHVGGGINGNISSSSSNGGHSAPNINNGIRGGGPAAGDDQEEEEDHPEIESSLPLLINGNNNNNNKEEEPHITTTVVLPQNDAAATTTYNSPSSIMLSAESSIINSSSSSSSPNYKAPPPLVFYDNTQGKWKCRICTWTYHHRRNGTTTLSVHHTHNHTGHQLHILNNIIIKPFSYFHHHHQYKPGAVVQPTNGFAYGHHHIHEEEINGEPSTPTFKSSHEIQTDDHDLIINEDEPPEVDLDVEDVLKNQTTHDLFCPNCKSCITTRVVLRKRKRTPQVISTEEPKRNKTETATTESEPSDLQAEGGDDTQLPEADDEERHMDSDLFRCLSCFSFFIPCGNGFKLFRKSGDKHERQSNVGDEQVPNVRKNWLSFMFQSNNKQETAIEQGGNLETEQRQDRNVAFPSSSSSSSNIGVKVSQSEVDTGEKLKESESTKEVYVNDENDPSKIEPQENTLLSDEVSAEETFTHSHGELKLLVSSDNGHATSEETNKSNHNLQFGSKDNDVVEHLPTSFSAFPESNMGEKLSISVAIPHEGQQGGTYILTESVVENKNATFASTQPGDVHPSDVSQQIITKARYEVHTGETLTVDNISSVSGLSVAQGKDTVITIETRPAESSQMLQGLISPDASASALHSGTHITIGNPERRVEGKQIEVIKSIVYGGLAESITSLSVVSSAAGGGAATLNILALGMANLIGGLFVIFHNLWELRCDRVEQVTNQITGELTNEKDWYRKLLGRRENFILHSVVAIISYLIFGLLPPAVYGFSFRKSDDKEFKLLAVAAASLVSILILAIGKAYVQRPPKHYIKCVLSFVMLGFMVSGVSYAAGILVERLLEKFHLFESSPVTDFLVPEMTGANSAWSAY